MVCIFELLVVLTEVCHGFPKSGEANAVVTCLFIFYDHPPISYDAS